ncbi:hypothetical protein DFJ74DRAFT_687363 [Hyaloraphidium curvatum]|nr:hypothetical protein DFJ74DRAFT_687363 [Hyaloraphidium curvatum]
MSAALLLERPRGQEGLDIEPRGQEVLASQGSQKGQVAAEGAFRSSPRHAGIVQKPVSAPAMLGMAFEALEVNAPNGPAEVPAKKPRKKAAQFDERARTRWLLYRREKRVEHARKAEGITQKDLFDVMAADFGARYPEYDYAGSELLNLEKSLRRTYTAYEEAGYDKGRTLRLQGKAPPKPELWDAMKVFFGGAESSVPGDGGSLVLQIEARAVPAPVLSPHPSPPGSPPRPDPHALGGCVFAPSDGWDIDVGAGAGRLPRSHEDVIEESDDDTRQHYLKGQYVAESDDEARAAALVEHRKRRKWQSVIGAARTDAREPAALHHKRMIPVVPTAKQEQIASDVLAKAAHTVEGCDGMGDARDQDVAGLILEERATVPNGDHDLPDGAGDRIRDRPAPIKSFMFDPNGAAKGRALVPGVELRPGARPDHGAATAALVQPVLEKKKRGRPRKDPEADKVEKPKKPRVGKDQAAEEEQSLDADGAALPKTKRRRQKDQDGVEGEPKPKKPRKQKAKAGAEAIFLSDTEREPVPPQRFEGPFEPDYPTRSVHFLRVTSYHVMRVVLYLKKSMLDGWWSERRLQEVLVAIRFALPGKLEKEFKSKAKGLAEIHRDNNFAVSYYLTPNEVDHSYLVFPDNENPRLKGFCVYPQAVVAYAERPRPLGLPEFWGVKFAKQPAPPKPPKKPRGKGKKPDAGEPAAQDLLPVAKRQSTIEEITAKQPSPPSKGAPKGSRDGAAPLCVIDIVSDGEEAGVSANVAAGTVQHMLKDGAELEHGKLECTGGKSTCAANQGHELDAGDMSACMVEGGVLASQKRDTLVSQERCGEEREGAVSTLAAPPAMGDGGRKESYIII